MKKLFALLPLILAVSLTAFADDLEEPTPEPERPIPEFKEMILPVKDEAAKDPTLVKFRDSLQKAVKQKSVKDLVKHLDTKIKNNFGSGTDGLKEFKATWKLDKSPAKSAVWAELGKVLSLGGGFMEATFAAPYIYAHWPDEYDAFEYSVVVTDTAQLRKEASDKSASVRPLKREIVYVIDTGEDQSSGWREVATFDKQRGFVKESEIHSPIGYRALFSKKNGAWKITHFIAGD
jgi:hypothetical protein